MKTLPLVMRKQILCSQLVCLFGGFNVIKTAKVFVFAVVLYLCHVFFYAWVEANASYAELVVCLYALVFAVLLHRNIAQVLNSVVQFIAVNMVDCLFREISKFKQPNEPMHGVFLSVKLNVPISSRSDAPSNRANFSSWLVFFSKQQAILFVIFKKFGDTLFDIFGLVHKEHYR